MRRLPPLSALRTFEAAARLGSFKRAAAELGVTPTAVSHQVRALEGQLGTKLFERRVREVVLTSAGQTLFPVLRDGLDAFADALRDIAPQQRRRTLIITATPAFAAHWLVGRLVRFQAANPAIDLRLKATAETLDLARGDADLAVRYSRGPFPGLVAVPLVADRHAPVVHPSLRLRSPIELHHVPLIHFDWINPAPAHPSWRRWFRAAGLAPVAPHAGLRFSEESHAIQAAVAGQGAGLLSLVLVADELRAGRLEQPFGPALDAPSYYLVHTPRAGASDDLGRLRAWLLAEMAGREGALR